MQCMVFFSIEIDLNFSYLFNFPITMLNYSYKQEGRETNGNETLKNFSKAG